MFVVHFWTWFSCPQDWGPSLFPGAKHPLMRATRAKKIQNHSCIVLIPWGPKFSKIKDVQFLTFDVKFKANINLPNHIGLGGKVSLGFGMVSGLTKPRT